ncbi:MAG: amidohydrolase family protein [Xanthobacteraceae bacterium]|jgi:predicted TIM-barrel fold metal-dependent hydrolase
MRKIDIFNHVTPKAYARKVEEIAGAPKDLGKRTRAVTLLHDLDARFRVMDRFDDYSQVITIPGPQPGNIAEPNRSPELARAGNDGLAELVRAHPDRFVAFAATLPMNNPDAAVAEAERAIRDLGAKGIEVFTNVRGKPLDLPEYLPLWQLMSRYDLPIWVHPSRSPAQTDYASESRSRFEIWFAFGYPYETAAAMSRIVFAGLFDKFPNLKFITHHMAGIVPFQEGRIVAGWAQLGSRTSDEDYTAVVGSLARPLNEYFKMFYADTAMFGARAGTACGVDYFGADHVVFASDMPFDPQPGQFIADTIRVIDSLDLSETDRAKIYFRNAEKLLKLS